MKGSLVAVVVAAALVAAACSESEPDDTAAGDDPTAQDDDGATTTSPDAAETDDGDGDGTGDDAGAGDGEPTVREGDTIAERFGGEEWFLGTVPDTAEAADPDAEPIVIGMINQEDTPLGSFPEIRRAVEGGVDFVNTELGGVGGRPLELVTCITSFSAEQSAACAQQMVTEGVVALVGGLDVTSNGSVPVLQANGIPSLGGVPANLVEQQSDVHFYFSGGVTGGLAAFLAHTADGGGDSAVLAYGEFESFAVAANDYAAPVAELLGVDLELVSYPLTTTDFLPVLTRAAESDPDSIIVAAAGTACAPIMTTFRDLGLDAQLYLVGACADGEIVEAAGDAADGVLFNTEGPPLSVETIENDLFLAIDEIYAGGEGGGTGTVGMRGFLNLYSILAELGPDGATREAVMETVRSSVDRPSFWGHPFTCDGAQVDGLPALCAPQQSIIYAEAPDVNVTVNEEWIDTVDLFARARG